MVEGVNFPRYHLRGVMLDPVRLPLPNRLVYAAHNYGYLGPQLVGQTYGDMDYKTFTDLITAEWGYVITPNQAYTAPVWVSEFGEQPNPENKQWFKNITRYLAENDFDFAYWALNSGPKASGAIEIYTLLADNWTEPLTDWRLDLLKPLMQAHQGPGVDPNYETDPAHHFAVATFSDWDWNLAEDRTDWLHGAFKARCHEGERLVGLSTGHRFQQAFSHEILCSDHTGDLKRSVESAPQTQTIVNRDEDAGAPLSHTQGVDWSRGATKLECEPGSYVAGTAQTRTALSYRFAGILCAKAERPLGAECHAVAFAKGDNRATFIPGDWDVNQRKGQCALNEYVAGVSAADGRVQAILCCPVSADR
jgi:hypothetical protein